MYISGKDKLGYINGDFPQPLETDPNFRKWRTENAIVKGWIMNSMATELIGNFIRFPTAKAVWDYVATIYFDGTDTSQTYDLKRKEFVSVMDEPAAQSNSYKSECALSSSNKENHDGWIIDSEPTLNFETNEFQHAQIETIPKETGHEELEKTGNDEQEVMTGIVEIRLQTGTHPIMERRSQSSRLLIMSQPTDYLSRLKHLYSA
ncbi:hypothetical protein BUALT_Bualt10G0012800 [Buddleja alternifolia]|uniref:Retrotransposon Copia-like N-terminal domain-containing protein n=1 Tax=Buddleja alternifolia TaxID=168488 RepID=A0AAV6X5W5_9LAMI|nr:hypothetical protein BUALT_Bualt10G0012800 [Buddleja alternifolia]